MTWIKRISVCLVACAVFFAFVACGETKGEEWDVSADSQVSTIHVETETIDTTEFANEVNKTESENNVNETQGINVDEALGEEEQMAEDEHTSKNDGDVDNKPKPESNDDDNTKEPIEKETKTEET